MKRLIYSLLLSFLFSLSTGMSQAGVPSIPASLQQKLKTEGQAQGKLIMLDFFSTYCGTCQMMIPYLKALGTETSRTLQIVQVNIDDPGNQKTFAAFNIEGTPTYIVYNPLGQPVYRMSNMIAPLVLDRQVMRLTHQLKAVSFPDSVKLPALKTSESSKNTDKNSRFGEMILVSFESKNCKDCQPMAPYIQGFELTGQKGLHIIHIDTDHSEGKQFLKKLSMTTLPAYALFDNGFEPSSGKRTGLRKRIDHSQDEAHARGELFQISGAIQAHTLWEMIRMFGDSGL